MTKLILTILTVSFFSFSSLKSNAFSFLNHSLSFQKDSININLNFLNSYQLQESNTNEMKPTLEVNTSNKLLNIKINEQTSGTITIINFRGKVVFSVQQNDLNGQFDISTLTAGKYILLIEGSDFMESCKIQIF